MVSVLRLGHRIERDKRLTTHCALVSRAFGAEKMFYTGDKDSILEESVKKISRAWGGDFVIEYVKDYRKLIMKLPQIASEDCTLLACLNSPDLNLEFIRDLIKELAPSFKFVKRLENVSEFASLDEDRSLKNLVFQRQITL